MGNTFEHETTESALKMPNQENNGKRQINFCVVCIDLLGTVQSACKQATKLYEKELGKVNFLAK